MSERDRILGILHANPGNQRANQCLTALATHPEAALVRTGPLPREHVLAMLRRRAEMSAAGITRPGDYQEPLATLAASQSPKVQVESVTVGELDWVILTTPGDQLIDVVPLAAAAAKP
jgi:hypothetical protein